MARPRLKLKVSPKEVPLDGLETRVLLDLLRGLAEDAANLRDRVSLLEDEVGGSK